MIWSEFNKDKKTLDSASEKIKVIKTHLLRKKTATEIEVFLDFGVPAFPVKWKIKKTICVSSVELTI